MTIPKENRQQMINLMYLVLTALLALNVSAAILDAFSKVNKSLTNSNAAIDMNNKGRFASFQDRITKEPDNKLLVTNMAKAKQVDQWGTELDQYVQGIISQVIKEAGGIDPETKEMKDRDDIDVSTRLLVEGPRGKGNGEGYNLEKRLNTFRADILKQFDDPALRAKVAGILSINTTPITSKDWVRETFYQMPAIATQTMLLKIQNDIKASKGEAISALMMNTDELIRINAQVKFENFSAEIMSPSSYVLKGEPLKVKLMLAATSNEAGAMKIVANGANLVPSKEGYAEFNANTSSVGEQTIQGYISLTRANGKTDRYDFEPFKYTVAMPFATVSPTKMNVFYIGVDNPVAASAAGVSAGQLQVSMTNGSITGSGGNYTVRVNAPGTAVVTVKDSRGRSFGNFDFRIKRIPDPVAKVANRTGGSIPVAEFKVQTGVSAAVDGFDFNCPFTVLGYNMVYAAKRADLAIASATSAYFTPAMRGFMSQAKPGDLVYIEEIRVRGCDNQTRKIPGITFKLQ